MKLTPWYPPNIKPLRRGVYITKVKSPSGKEYKSFQYWSGTFWKIMSATVENAYKARHFVSLQQDVHWKGIQK